MTEETSNAIAEGSNGGDVMATVIEFYLHGPVPKKVKRVPIEQRGQLVEFPEEPYPAQSKTEDIAGRGEERPSTIFCFGCF
jgi:hypothetical protein